MNTLDYKDYTTNAGESIKVYRVPMQVVLGVIPKTRKPKRPLIDMETKGGIQKRLSKEGDPEWEDFQEKLEEWKKKKSDLEDDVSLVLALRDIKIPDPIEFDEAVQGLMDAGLMEKPDNEYSKKALWLRTTLIGQHDENMISLTLQELNGVPEEVVEQMKANFRDILLGKVTGRVGDDTGANEVAQGDI